MKKKLEKLNNISSIILAFLLAVGIGAIGREVLVATNIIQPKQAVVEEEVKRDVMPLENGGEVFLQLIDKEKIILISYEDLKFVGSKKSKIKKLIKNIEALYARMEE